MRVLFIITRLSVIEVSGIIQASTAKKNADEGSFGIDISKAFSGLFFISKAPKGVICNLSSFCCK